VSGRGSFDPRPLFFGMSIKKKIFLLLVAAALGLATHPAHAQTVDVTMTSLQLPGDSLLVTFHLGSNEEALTKPVSSFEFLISHHENLELLSTTSDFTMTDVDGWTTALNKERGWVGGFASSLNAFKTGGALFNVFLSVGASFEGSAVCIESVRLNSDNPLASIPHRCVEF